MGVDIRSFSADPQTEICPLCVLLHMEHLKMALKYKSRNSGWTGRILSLSPPFLHSVHSLRQQKPFSNHHLLLHQQPPCATPRPSSAARARGPASLCPTNVTWRMTVGTTAMKVTVVSATLRSPPLGRGGQLLSSTPCALRAAPPLEAG